MNKQIISLLMASGLFTLIYPTSVIGGSTFKLTKEISVEQGQKARDLGVSRYEGICFLTGVTGKFEGGGEAVRVTLRGKNWYLEVKSQQRGVRAWARCAVFF